jgi:hypothetical protein
VLHHLSDLSYRNILEHFTEPEHIPSLLDKIREFFIQKAVGIQNGEPEYCESKEWLNIWWPVDELMFISLCAEGKLDQFYEQAKEVLSGLLQKNSVAGVDDILDSAIRLNRNLIKLPFQSGKEKISLDHNIWQFYQGQLLSEEISIEKGTFEYVIDKSEGWFDWQQWCREVVWYGNKKGAYLYGCQPANSEVICEELA